MSEPKVGRIVFGQPLDPSELAGIKRGLADVAAGRVKPLDEIRPTPSEAQPTEEDRLRAIILRVRTAVSAAIEREPDEVKARLYEACRLSAGPCWCGVHISHVMASAPSEPQPATPPEEVEAEAIILAAARRRLAVSDDIKDTDQCSGDRHLWPSDYQEGDTCNCGAFYVIASRSAGLIIEVAPVILATLRRVGGGQ